MERRESKRSGEGSKVRTGCITCKKRRVKCDETKPACIRCRNLNLDCAGYQRPKSELAANRLLRLVPKTPILSPPAISLTSNASLLQQPFSSGRDFQYFRVYCDTTAFNLGVHLDTPIWSHIVLQASEQESYIRDAVTAIGALEMATQERHATSNALPVYKCSEGDPTCTGLQIQHYEAAFQLYGKAIEGIRKACQEKRQSRRMILIACLLAICFEYFHGNINSAIIHVQHGLRLINDWFRSIIHLVTLEGEAFVPGVLEDELINVFSRLETDILWVHEKSVVEVHPELKHLAMDLVHSLPIEGFKNLSWARRYLDILLHQVDYFVWCTFNKLWTASDEPADTNYHIMAIEPSREEQDWARGLKQGFLRWESAFQASLSSHVIAHDGCALFATALALRHTCSSISLDCCFGPEMNYDAYISDFEIAFDKAELLAAAALALSKPSFIACSILVKSLYFIALKCRKMAIRTAAIDRLKRLNRREGIWDSRVASALATLVMKLERCDGDGEIPEHRRLRAVRTNFSIHKGRGTMKYFVPETESGQELVAHQKEFAW